MSIFFQLSFYSCFLTHCYNIPNYYLILCHNIYIFFIVTSSIIFKIFIQKALDLSLLYSTIVHFKILFQYTQNRKKRSFSTAYFHLHIYRIFSLQFLLHWIFILIINLTHFIWSCAFNSSVAPCFFTICSISISTCFLASWSIWFRCFVSFPVNSKYWYFADLCSFRNCFRNIPYFPYIGSS